MSERLAELLSLGARCNECPLGPKGCLRENPYDPVTAEYHEDDEAIVVGSHPSQADLSAGHPFGGESGGVWNDAAVAIGKHRTNFAITYAVACVPPGQASGGMERMAKKLERINKQRLSDGKLPLPSPQDCCRPRLFNEVAPFRNIITLGKRALTAITGDSRSVTKARGDFIEYDRDWRRIRRDPESGDLSIDGQPVNESAVYRKVLPTLEPSFVAKSPGWQAFWYQDLGKAIRWFENRLRWIEPLLLLEPTADQLKRWLEVKAPFWVFDVETEYRDFLEAYLRCYGFATPDVDANGRAVMPGADYDMVARSVGVSLLSGDGSSRLCNPDEEEGILDVTRWFLSDRSKLKVGSNAGYVDRMVMERLGSEDGPIINYPCNPVVPWLPVPTRRLVVEPVLDNLFLSRAWLPEVPKGLKTVGTALTDIGHWENEGGAAAENDRDRLIYNTRGDTVVNARIIRPLVDIAKERGYFDIIVGGDRERRVHD